MFDGAFYFKETRTNGRAFCVVHTLISRTCEYANLHEKWDFAGVIKVKDPELGRLSWVIQEGPNHKFLKLPFQAEVRVRGRCDYGIMVREV